MGVTRKIISPGNGSDFPTKGDKVGVEHIVYHHDGTKSDEDFKGEQIFASKDEYKYKDGIFQIEIGTGNVIKGWDEEIPKMSLGEQSILIIPSDYAYGNRGWPDLIGPGSALVCEVTLRSINERVSEKETPLLPGTEHGGEI